MTKSTATRRLLSLCVLSLLATQPATAQPSGGGPLRERLQDWVQSEIDRKVAQTRTQIEQQLASRPSPAEIAQVRQVQTALNFFTFDAGPVDGMMGQLTQAAIKEFQTYIGEPVTGQLAESELQFLLVSYQKAQANSAQAQEVADNHSDGIKGLLLIFRDGEPARATGVMPGFRTTDASRSASAFCATATDPAASEASMDQTLGQLYCSATAAAIDQSDALAATVAGFTPAQIEEQCVAFEPALVSVVQTVSDGPAKDVMQGAAEFVQRTGQDPQEMAGIAKVCLGVGYRRDHIDLAIGSAVLLTVLDAAIYAEYVGYHAALGVGADQDATRARSWFEVAMQNDKDGQSDFDAQAVERMKALQNALMQNGADGATEAMQVPSFSIND